MKLILILLLNLAVPTGVVIPNTIGDVVNSGGSLETYIVLNRDKDSILLALTNDDGKLVDTIQIHKDLLDFNILYYPFPSFSFVDANGEPLGVDTLITQNGDIAIIPKRRIVERDDNFINATDTICFLVSPENRQSRFPTNSVFGVINNKMYVLSYAFPDSATDFRYNEMVGIQSYDQFRKIIRKMISYRDMNFKSEGNIIIAEVYEDFINHIKMKDYSYGNFKAIGANLVFLSKSFDRLGKLRIQHRINGFYDLHEFANSNFPRYINFRHAKIMPVNSTKEFKKSLSIVMKKGVKDKVNFRQINQFIINYLDQNDSTSGMQRSVDKLLSRKDLDDILYSTDQRLIMDWMKK